MNITLDMDFGGVAFAKSSGCEGLRISFNDYTRADRTRRQVIETIETCETPAEVADYIEREDQIITAIRHYSDEMANSIQQAADDQAAITESAHGGTVQKTPEIGENDMAANPDFHKIMIRDASLQWPRLDQPYRFDPVERKTEPCNAAAQGAGYSISWAMSEADAKALAKECRDHYANCMTRKPSMPKFAKIFSGKKLDDGTIQFTAKRRAVNAQGVENKPPLVIDKAQQPLEDPAIWSGSTGTIRLTAYPATDPNSGEGGISFLFDVVQVTEPVYGGASLEEDFGTPAASANDMDDFNTAKPAAAPAPAAAADDIDDDLPF